MAASGQATARTTNRQIADALQLSESTVSRALSPRNASLVARETRDRIRQKAYELNYVAKSSQVNKRPARGRVVVGVIVRDSRDLFFPHLVHSLIAEARGLGWLIILGFAESRSLAARRLEETLETRHCHAIILAGDFADDPIASELIATHVPLVGLCQGARLPGVPVVNTDNTAGCRLVMSDLYHAGHQRIAFLTGRGIGDVEDRAREHERYLRNINPGRDLFDETLVVPATNNPAGGAQGFLLLMGRPDPPTAIVAATDAIAFGCLWQAARMNIPVPGGVSIAGYDDIPWFEHSVPPLTTVRQPVGDLARGCLRLVDELLDHQSRGLSAKDLPNDRDWDRTVWPPTTRLDTSDGRRVFLIPPQYVPRGSTGPAPAATSQSPVSASPSTEVAPDEGG